MSADNMDTKPTIETVLSRISGLGEQISSVKTDLVEIVSMISALSEGIRTVELKIDVLNKNMLQMQADNLRLERRVDDLERKVS